MAYAFFKADGLLVAFARRLQLEEGAATRLDDDCSLNLSRIVRFAASVHRPVSDHGV